MSLRTKNPLTQENATLTKLFDLIMQAEALVDALASHPEYVLLQDNDYLTDLDVQLGDVELFLMQLNKALRQATESQAGGGLPRFEERS